MSPVVAVAVPADLRALFFPDDALSGLGEPRVAADGADLGAPEVLAELAGPADVLVTSWPCAAVTGAVLAASPSLRLVAHTGASVKPYVGLDAFERGVRVTQAGAAMARAVGEQAVALTLALLHRVHRFDSALRSGTPWTQAKVAPPRHELAGSAVGVVGASRTGRAYIELVRSLGGVVTVADPYLSASEAASLGVRVAGLDDVLRGSRVLALHAPVLPETRRMIGARELALLPDGALLVNTARAALVDGDALLAELRSGRLDAAIDVFDEQPLPVGHPLRSLPNVLLTPHEAGGTVEARARGGRLVAAEIGRFLGGEPLQHEVTSDQLARLG
ncbi:hydroxyacid dehydrogenase [Jiangella alba]|uniref:Phosphoglycerate dehydrogenase n=1 Tax=Jiangella alba TaxID=561176 RepID=A0A1H5CAA9_9ACTN|nr:hydroxyacid dehydrogenase [Jiangella alba]SED63408.1 Phosphoglycerate dehydrogenase [Jiangella alba]